MAILVAFVLIETRVAEPMFNLGLFRIRAFAAGNLAVLLSAIASGGMQFMLIMWLQGIWLPLHGYSFAQTPLWAGIYMLPMTLGFLVAGPVSGTLSDRHGARPFATAGMLLAAGSFLLLMALPADFAYWLFALVLFLNGLAFGMFAAPNTAAVMNSVPARNRGVASGMRATCQMLGMPLSIGIFFSLMVVGLTANVPSAMFGGLTAHHVPAQVADLALPPAADRLPVRRLPRATTRCSSCSGRTSWGPCRPPTPMCWSARSSSPRSSAGPSRTASSTCSSSPPRCAWWRPWRRCCGAASSSTTRRWHPTVKSTAGRRRARRSRPRTVTPTPDSGAALVASSARGRASFG